jgi:hypothetical protein
MDHWGDHALQCRVCKGVAVAYRYIAVRDILYRMAKELGLDAVESPISLFVSPGRRGDDLTYCLRIGRRGRDLYLDVVGSSSLAGF